MSRVLRNKRGLSIDRRWLYGGAALLILLMVFFNCSPSYQDQHGMSDKETLPLGVATGEDEDHENSDVFKEYISDDLEVENLFADSSLSTNTQTSSSPSPANISLNVKDANMLDVLSLLAHKLNVNIIFLDQPGTVSINLDNMTPTATLHLLLQKEGLDYIAVGKNYIVGSRGRLYDDFGNQILLTRFGLTYVSASAMEGYLANFGVNVQSLTIDSNQEALWMQGTPIELGRARQIINALDIRENASFAEGGSRKIRIPVATASGGNAEEQLEALIDLLSFLLDGVRDGRTDLGWVTWDHPDPVPRIYVDWEDPVLKPYDIKMKITRDFANNPSSQLRYLIAEGSPDNIEVVSTMIATIRGTPASPLTFDEPATTGGNVVQWGVGGGEPVNTQYISYGVDLKAVPSSAGNLSGSGTYVQGSTVTISAEPSEGYSFVRWIENGVELTTDPLHTFTIYSNRRFEAVFISDQNNEEEDPVDQ